MWKHEILNIISMVEKTCGQYHRSKIIIHSGNGFYYAEFNTIEQLQHHAEMLGFTYELISEEESKRYGMYSRYKMSHKIYDPCDGGFCSHEDLPDGSKPFKALSNGKIVTCYFYNDGKNIKIYRPNPNAEDVYKPLSLYEHIKHKKVYGCY